MVRPQGNNGGDGRGGGPAPARPKPVLLAVCTTAPWPVDNGYNLRVFNLLRELSARWSIRLVAAPPEPGAPPFPAEVAEYLPVAGLSGDVLAYPWRFDQAPLRAAVAAAVAAHRPDCALVWRGAEALWFDAPGLPPAVTDLIDCTPLDLWRGIVAQRSLRLRLRKLRELGVSARYARRTVRSFAAVACAGEQDRVWLRWIGGRPRAVHMVPNGVRLPVLAPAEDGGEPDGWAAAADRPTVSFVGTLNFEPNVDAAEFLVREVWPRVRAAVPDARLVLAGRNPGPDLLAMSAAAPGVEVQADVPDMGAVLLRSWCSIAPMRSGVGVKNKILESWACARPAVLTPLAANGLDVPQGQEALIRRAPEALADSVAALLQAPHEARRLGLEARRHAEARYSWDAAADRLDALLQEAAAPHGPQAVDEARLADGPTLFVVVDTEAEFDWSAGFSRGLTSVSAIAGVHRGQAILDRHGLRPIYVIDYPVASQPEGHAPLRRILDRGGCAIGAHLHPWTTPPFEEAVSEWTSFGGNLPRALEERKLAALVGMIRQTFGRAPRFFKAGRYGVAPRTMEALARHGIEVDFSIMPGLDLTPRGGPDFRPYAAVPYRFGDVLSLPMTRAYTGALAGAPPGLVRALDGRRAARLRLPGALARTGLLNRVTLTPEGVTAREQIALIRRRLAQGRRIFVLHYHSPSLMPGHTPYARTEADVEVLLGRLSEVCRFFVEEAGGAPGDPEALLARARRLRGAGAPSDEAAPAEPAAAAAA